MNLTSTLVNQRPRRARMLGPAPAAVAILYPKVGNVLRVPLRRTRTGGRAGCEQHPERQFIVWFNRMAAARPGFPMQIRSILLITGQPLCASCHRALATYLSRYYLADKLRLRTTNAAACGRGGNCGCGSNCSPRHRTDGSGRPVPALTNVLLDDLLDDLLGEAPHVGPYRQVRGHHIHQSGAYATGGASARNNPNHAAASAIQQIVPGFTHAQHDRASAVQRGVNRAAHGADVDERAGLVRVRTSGTGTLAPTPTPGFEDLKAYYALLAAGKSSAEALRLVNQSAQQLARVGARPVRVPTR